MNKLLFVLAAVLTLILTSCEKEEPMTANCTVEGRWIVEIQGQANTLYEFHEGKRYTIYTDTEGVFGTREDAIPNPNDYTIEGDSLIIDLNFGNFSRSVPTFKCDCNIMILSDDPADEGFYLEGYDPELCNE